MTKEQKFYNVLKDVFVGAKVEGESGYINLMRIKSRYYEEGVFPRLQEDIEKATESFPEFKEELFDKLYTFFESYFSESGSIYFRYTPIHKNVYEKVYTDDKDVMLFWKTHMLYYVKTDRLFKNLELNVDGYKFFFDVSTLEHKRANEKRNIVFEFKEKRKDEVLVFTVSYSERGTKTKIDEILRELRREGIEITDEILEKAFRIFERQSEVDYFINKNAKKFLREQFYIWLYQYVLSGESEWTEKRIKQLQVLKHIAFKIIDFISQFEDELVKIWNKPKFVRNSNYVISLKTLKLLLNKKDYDKYVNLLKSRLAESADYRNDVKKVVEEVYRDNVSGIFIKNCKFGNDKISLIFHKREDVKTKNYKIWDKYDKKRPKYLSYENLYIDTKFFDEEFKYLLFNDITKYKSLEELLDGVLIKSENWQSLNTMREKYRDKVDMIYIDPPFNTKESGFLYQDRFLDSSWLSLMNDRIDLSLDLLKKGGNFYLHLDENADYYGRILLNDKLTFQRELIWNVTAVAYSEKKKKWIRSHDVIEYYTKGHEPSIFNPIFEEGTNGWDIDKMGSILGGKGSDIITTKYTLFNRNENIVDFNTQKTESLLARLIKVSSNKGGIVLDFFAGTGTTLAAAHKLNRRWIGIEMAEYFDRITLPRMKKVLFGDYYGISPETNWQGGGFFKYYELEQYEDTLRKVRYEDADLFDNPHQDPYSQYVFMKDLKMIEALKVDYENNKVKVDLTKLYPNIDIPETLSNILGKWIKRISSDYVEFEDGEKIDLKNLDYKIIKSLVWW